MEVILYHLMSFSENGESIHSQVRGVWHGQMRLHGELFARESLSGFRLLVVMFINNIVCVVLFVFLFLSHCCFQ